MAVHNDEEAPIEVKTKMVESCPFCFSERNKITKKGFKTTNPDQLTNVSNVTLKRKIKKFKKKSKKAHHSSTSCTTTDCEDNRTTEVNEEDLSKLRTVYKQCRSVMRKIEMKYGHLFDKSSSDSTSSSSKKRSRQENNQTNETECRCTLNKRIVFDEDGKEVPVDTLPINHVCPSKFPKHQVLVMNIKNTNIEIEYYNKNTELTENLQELHSILKNPSIETAYRNQVIEKLKLLKQVHLNEIKFTKVSLIEKIKINPNDVLSFTGSNLPAITGYCY